MNKNATTTAGVDLGDKYSAICVIGEDGEVQEEARIRTTQTGFERYFRLRSQMRVVIEVGSHSRWVAQQVAEMGHDVVVANPRRVRLIAESNHKNDDADAELLARLGRADVKLLAPIKHRNERVQNDLAVIRARAALVAARTLLVNSVRGQVKATGARLPRCSTECFHKRADELPEQLKESLTPTMTAIGELTAATRACDKRIEQLATETYPEAAALTQVVGVASLTALTFVLTLEDPTKFRRGRSVGAFLGLTPRQRQTGSSDPQLRITKAGDSYLRKLLVNAAQYIVGPFGADTALRQWGLKLASRGGKNAKKRAVVAVARKLAVLLHRLWVTGENYKTFPNEASAAAA